MYADDILLYKPIGCPEDYSGLQTDIDAIQDCPQSGLNLALIFSKARRIRRAVILNRNHTPTSVEM